MGILLHLSESAFKRLDDEWEIFAQIVGSQIGRFAAAKAVLLEPQLPGALDEVRRRIGEMHIINCRELGADAFDEALGTPGLKITTLTVTGSTKADEPDGGCIVNT